MRAKLMSKTIGIDFGTSTSSAAYHDGVSVRLFETPDGQRIMPSAVSLKDDRVFVGQPALNEMTENSEFTFLNIKRYMGEPWIDPEDQGFQTTEAEGGMVGLVGTDKTHLPEDLTALILAELKRMAEAEIGPVTGAVITVPSDCSAAQIDATVSAGIKAGFETVTTLPEPMSAAIGYGVGKNAASRIGVYDLGGGTFDFALMSVRRDSFNPIHSLGINHLGGSDFDKRIAKYVTDLFLQEHSEQINGEIHDAQLANIEFQSESAKKKLSTNDVGRVRAIFVARDKDGGPLHLSHDLSVNEFEGLIHDYIESTIDVCRDCMEQAGKTMDDIDEILLVGGMTRVPAVQRAVEAFFGKKPIQRNPDTIVAEGAAIKAAQIDGRINLSHENTAQASYGLQNPDGTVRIVIPRGSPFGTEKSLKLTTLYDNQPFLRIVVVRGDSVDALENELIEVWDEPVKLAKAGKPTVKLKLTLNDSGVLGAHVGG
jgi:molecular chaperone DnaK